MGRGSSPCNKYLMPKKDKPWSGVFGKGTHPMVERFTASLPFDKRLYRYDIQGSIAHARMLAKGRIITKKEVAAIVKGLKEVEAEIAAGRFDFDLGLEDIHMNIENRLLNKIGEAGAKVHSGRSRNDQIALDLRLYLRDEIKAIKREVRGLQGALAGLARKHLGVPMPGYTHMRRAQPVLFSHYLLAYYQMLKRDEERLADCLTRVNIMPLGAAALAGSGLPLDREYGARLLKFPAVTKNSIDSVSDRDFAIEFVAAASIIMMHLSRLCEDLILFSSEEFGFIFLPEEFLTGSSLMPQKKNPDVLELIRGKTGRVYGALFSLLTIMKGLPLSYNRDMQEDKEPLFDAVDTLKESLPLLTELMKGISIDDKRMREACERGFLTATDAADYLVRKGVPFRQAHKAVGRLVRYCLEKKIEFKEVPLAELKKFSEKFDADFFQAITVAGSLAARRSVGGTAEERVAEVLAEVAKELGDKRRT